MAEKLFEQLKTGEVNPARILSAYEDAEQQREVAALFNATVRVETKAELEKALNETCLLYTSSSWIKRRRIFTLKTKISTSFWIRSSSA